MAVSSELPQLLTVEAVSGILGVHRETVARSIREKKLKCVKMGHRTVRVHPQDLLDYINGQRGSSNSHNEMTLAELQAKCNDLNTND